jgi:hypothetical protein
MSYNTVTVAATAGGTLIVAANPQRLSLIITNTGVQTVYIGQDTSLDSSNGVPLLTNATLTEDSGGTKMYCGPIYGITATSTSDVRYWERTR